MGHKPPLGELMVQLGFLTRQQLEGSLAHQKTHGLTLGRAALAKGFCSDGQVLQALSRQLGFPIIDLDQHELDLAGLMPEAFSRKCRAVAVQRIGPRRDEVLVAIAAPARLDTQDAVRAVLGKSKLRFALASDAALERAFTRVYGPPAASEQPADLTPPPTPPAAARVQTPPQGVPLETLAALQLSPRTIEVLKRAAVEQNVTPREIARRVLESWASSRRAL